MELPQCSKEIEKISLDILKASRSYGVFPTPVDKVTQYSELISTGGIDINSLEKKYKNFVFTDALKSGLSKIRGFLDRKEKIIYLDTKQQVSRQGFVKLHETGHHVLPWQAKVLQFVDDDKTLAPETKEEFEVEANYFASITLFQHDVFLDELKKYELGIPAVIQLSKYFGASNHATIRRYVEHSPKRCALIVLENIQTNGQLQASHRNSFHSRKFVREFGELIWPAILTTEWAFIVDCRYRRLKTDGIISLATKNGMKEFHYHFFNNSFNVFVLFFPKGENKKTRTKIVIKN